MTYKRAAVWTILAALSALAGCGGRGSKTFVTHVPQWEYQNYKRVAVVAGKPTDPRASNDARLLADRLTTLLTQGGAFTVLSRDEMKNVFAEQDLSKLADAVDEGTALPEGKLEVAQALIVPKITDYKLVKQREERAIPRFARDPRGRRLLDRFGRPIQVGEDRVYIYTHGAEVEGTVRVVDPATGKILLSHTARVAPEPRTNYERPPSESPEAIASRAVEELATDFFHAVAPTRIRVDLKSKMLLVATDYFDGRYDETTKLSRSNSEFIIAVRDLPASADRNDFRIAVAEEGGRENLFQQEFTWSGSAGPEGVSYRVPMETLTRTGGERFVLKLYSVGDPEPKIERPFTLVTPK